MNVDAPTGFQQSSQSNSFATFVGPLYEKWDAENYICGFRAAAHHCDFRSIVHDGMLFTLAHHALSNMVVKGFKNQPCSTVTLNVDYLGNAVSGDWIECTCHITRQTRSLIFIKGQLSIDDQNIMTASGIWKKLDAD